jgi:hypothetical protein
MHGSKDKHKKASRLHENRYFLKLDRQLLEEQRRKDSLKADRAEMGKIAGITDDSILGELQDLGYNSETVRLLPILPLVQVAWSEGYVTRREREAILNVARSRGLDDDSKASRQLLRWLKHPPHDQAFMRSLKALSSIYGARAPKAATVVLRQIVEACIKVAESSGGFLGLVGPVSEVEQQVIDRIESVLRAGQ